MKAKLAVVLIWIMTAGDGFAQPSAENPAQNASERLPRKLTADGLPNPVQVHPKVISGGLPDGEAGFRQLARWGVQTVICVDGAKPDVLTAKKFGLRYVHLPHGYDGISSGRVRELAKAVRDLPGPIYLHCHHGKHRSPAAAGAACVAAGFVAASEAKAILDLAGTSDGYQGLYHAVRSAVPIPPKQLDSMQVEFQEVVAVPPLAEAMVKIGHVHDHLKQIAAAGWRTPKDHPDLDPAHEALMLNEHYAELLRTNEVQTQPLAFRNLLRQGEADAAALRDAVVAWEAKGAQAPPPKRVARLAQRISDQCKSCHVRYRDATRH